MFSRQPSKLPAPPMPPDVVVPTAAEVAAEEGPWSSERGLSSGAERARESEGEGGAMRTREVASRCPARKLLFDSTVGDSQVAPPSAGFCRTSFRSPNDPKLDFFMTFFCFLVQRRKGTIQKRKKEKKKEGNTK
jgi:hypothetical protein